MSGATTSSATNEASDGPDTSCNGDVERRDDRRSADALYAEPGMAEHDPGQEDARELSADEARRPGAASCPDPLALLFEHAVMLTRMAAVGATETLKLLTPNSPQATVVSAPGTTTGQFGDKQQRVEE